MREVTPESAAEYLRERGRVAPGREVRVQALGWGVSNVVMRVDVAGEAPFVLKQARERLRTEAYWVSRLDRVWTESAALGLLGEVLSRTDHLAASVPRVLFTEPDDFLFAMTCAPDDARVWKALLLAGETDPACAQAAGRLLGSIHVLAQGHAALSQGRLTDLEVFGQLRIDPFYRALMPLHPELAAPLQELIDSLQNPPIRTFVHADFSPKNLLVHAHGLTVVDFETAHAGDPAYDVGFFLSHLLLKTLRAAPAVEAYQELGVHFLDRYHEQAIPALGADLLPRAWRHAAACALARVDGTSLVDYLDRSRQQVVRRFAYKVLQGKGEPSFDLMSTLAREML